ncbi:MAG: rutF [Caulobacteraceae bacterium]|nr:rutF [Caulobacteraceae bacterium]
MVTRDSYRNGMARLAAAVNVITTDGPAGASGFTASAVCSVTDDPPTLLVCVNLSSRQNDFLRGNGVLCVNTLAAGQAQIAALFSTRDLAMDQRFAAAAWSRLATGAPVLEGAAVSFDCRIVERLERGTHAVILCEVLAIQVGGECEALVYFGRGYRTLGQTD